MEFVEPKVFLVGETRIVEQGLEDYLRHVGAADWTTDAPSDSERLSEAITGLNRMIATLGFENIRTLALAAEGRLSELEGDCETGLEKYSAALELNPAHASLHTKIGRCGRKLGRLDEAAASLASTLKVRPADAEALLELALVREEAGDREAALEQVEAALEVWAEADPGFEPAADARALKRRLGG